MLKLLNKVDRDQIMKDLQELQNNPEENIQNIEKDSESENSDEENENVRGMKLRNGKRTVTFSK